MYSFVRNRKLKLVQKTEKDAGKRGLFANF